MSTVILYVIESVIKGKRSMVVERYVNHRLDVFINLQNGLTKVFQVYSRKMSLKPNREDNRNIGRMELKNLF